MRRKKIKLYRMGVSLPEPLLNAFDAISVKQGYSQRSEAIRDLIRMHIERYASRNAKGNEIGVVAYAVIKELQEKDLNRKIAHCESKYRDIIKSVTPVILSDTQIFMSVIVDGDAKRITEFSDAMGSLKGVVLVGYSSWGFKNE